MARAATGKRLIFGFGAGVVAAILGAALFTHRAEAGKRSTGALAITDDGMYGSMGTARSSLDLVQLVKCEVMGTDDGTAAGILTARCTITIPDPLDPLSTKSKACYTGNKAIVEAIESAGDSRISVSLDPLSGACLALTTFNSSEYAPKTP
jgi:hypothetical protein